MLQEHCLSRAAVNVAAQSVLLLLPQQRLLMLLIYISLLMLLAVSHDNLIQDYCRASVNRRDREHWAAGSWVDNAGQPEQGLAHRTQQ